MPEGVIVLAGLALAFTPVVAAIELAGVRRSRKKKDSS